jgi:hypothetical protein
MAYKIYYQLPNGRSYAFVARSGTSTLGLMCLRQFHPDRMTQDFVDGKAHRALDSVVSGRLPAGCGVMVRHPLERFQSLLWRVPLPVEQALSLAHWHYGAGPQPANTDRHWLEYTYGVTAYHYAPVSFFAQPDSQLFRFPDLRGMADYLGCKVPLAHINKTEHPVTLTPEQSQQVLEVYADDLRLWESLQ